MTGQEDQYPLYGRPWIPVWSLRKIWPSASPSTEFYFMQGPNGWFSQAMRYTLFLHFCTLQVQLLRKIKFLVLASVLLPFLKLPSQSPPTHFLPDEPVELCLFSLFFPVEGHQYTLSSHISDLRLIQNCSCSHLRLRLTFAALPYPLPHI